MTHLYPEKMLPTIGYHHLYSNDFTDLTHLEFEVMEDLRKMVEGVKTILSREALVQIAKLYVAHLCAYLGFYTVSSLGIEKGARREAEMSLVWYIKLVIKLSMICW